MKRIEKLVNIQNLLYIEPKKQIKVYQDKRNNNLYIKNSDYIKEQIKNIMMSQNFKKEQIITYSFLYCLTIPSTIEPFRVAPQRCSLSSLWCFYYIRLKPLCKYPYMLPKSILSSFCIIFVNFIVKNKKKSNFIDICFL